MHSKMSSAICLNLDQSKILSSGDGLNKKAIIVYHLQHGPIVDFPKLKEFSDPNYMWIKLSEFIRLENIVGKGENAGYLQGWH